MGEQRMNVYDSYVKMTEDTAAYPRDNELAYLALGACGEAAEFAQKMTNAAPVMPAIEIAKELGDLQWYLCRLTLYYKAPWNRICEVFPQESYHHSMAQELTTTIGQIAEIAKKTLRDGPKWSPEKHDEQRNKALDSIAHAVQISRSIASYLYFTYEDVLKLNTDKLLDRKERNVLHGSGDNR